MGNKLLHIGKVLILRILHIVIGANETRHGQDCALTIYPDTLVGVVLRNQHGCHVPRPRGGLGHLPLIQRVDHRLHEIVAVRVLWVQEVNGDHFIPQTL